MKICDKWGAKTSGFDPQCSIKNKFVFFLSKVNCLIGRQRIRKTLDLLTLSLLCACGGGAKDTSTNQTSAGGGTVPTPSGGPQIPTEFRLMETLPDNHSVVRFFQSQESAVYTGLSAGQEIASDLAVGNLTVHGARNNLPNNQYSISGRAMTSRGTDLDLLIRGLFLNSDDTEYVTRMFVSNSNGNMAYFVQGTPACSLPSSVAAYKGFAEISRMMDPKCAKREISNFGSISIKPFQWGVSRHRPKTIYALPQMWQWIQKPQSCKQ